MRTVGPFTVTSLSDGAVSILTMHTDALFVPGALVQDLLLAIVGEHADPTLRILKLHAATPEEITAYQAMQEDPPVPDVLEDRL